MCPKCEVSSQRVMIAPSSTTVLKAETTSVRSEAFIVAGTVRSTCRCRADWRNVDTPGHNGLRRDRMAELSSFLQSARQRQVLLTVPATMKASDLTEVVSAFSTVALDGAIITRCDETSHFGHMAGVLIESALGLAYTTRSDQVSDAPMPADNLAFAEAIVRAQWPALPATIEPRRLAADRTLAKVG